jgi:hypothetical protein
MGRPTPLAPLVAALSLLIALLLARPLFAPGSGAPVAAARSSPLTSAGNNADTLRVRSQGTKTVDVPRLDPESCETDTLNVSDARSGDLAWVFPDKDVTDDGPVTVQVNGEQDDDEISYTVCNATDKDVNPPSGDWAYLVVQP